MRVRSEPQKALPRTGKANWFLSTQLPSHATAAKRDGVSFYSDCIPPPRAYWQVRRDGSPASTVARTQTSSRIPHGGRRDPFR